MTETPVHAYADNTDRTNKEKMTPGEYYSARMVAIGDMNRSEWSVGLGVQIGYVIYFGERFGVNYSNSRRLDTPTVAFAGLA
jgi:hypothetical protein